MTHLGRTLTRESSSTTSNDITTSSVLPPVPFISVPSPQGAAPASRPFPISFFIYTPLLNRQTMDVVDTACSDTLDAPAWPQSNRILAPQQTPPAFHLAKCPKPPSHPSLSLSKTSGSLDVSFACWQPGIIKARSIKLNIIFFFIILELLTGHDDHCATRNTDFELIL